MFQRHGLEVAVQQLFNRFPPYCGRAAPEKDRTMVVHTNKQLRRTIRDKGMIFPRRCIYNRAEDLTSDGVHFDVKKEKEKSLLQNEDLFDVKKLFTLKDLFEARVHLGHKEGLRDSYMLPYISGSRLGVDIIDLDQTVPLLQDALNFTAHVAMRGGIILFLTRHQQSIPWVENTAVDVGEYSHCRRWKGGTFTNSTVQFGAETRLPDLCIFMNCHNDIFEPHVATIETAKMSIPTVGIVDTATDPRLITYPVPGNDDTPSAVKLYLSLFKEAILAGKAKKKELEELESQK